MEFLRERAARIGYELFIQDGKLNFCQPESKESLNLKWLNEISTFSIRVTSAEQVKAVEVMAMTGGGWLIDTPGMREVQLSDAYDGIGLFFDDLTALSLTCKFRNCRHAGEPGCAVQGAIAAGDLDPARLVRWQKLLAEDGTNTATMETSALRAAGRRFYPKKK